MVNVCLLEKDRNEGEKKIENNSSLSSSFLGDNKANVPAGDLLASCFSFTTQRDEYPFDIRFKIIIVSLDNWRIATGFGS